MQTRPGSACCLQFSVWVAFTSRNLEFEASGFNDFCVLCWLNWFTVIKCCWDEKLVRVYNGDLRESFEGVFWFTLGTWVTGVRSGGLSCTALPIWAGLWSARGSPLGCIPQPGSPVLLSGCCRFWAVCCLCRSCDVGKVVTDVPQHGHAVLVPFCEATVLQEHSCALFPASIRSPIQIRDFLCICWRKAWAPIIPWLPHLAWNPVLLGSLLHCPCSHPLSRYRVMGWLSSLFVLSKFAGTVLQHSPLLPGHPWGFAAKRTFLGWHTQSSWSALVKRSCTWP